jgi:hypothetical protein
LVLDFDTQLLFGNDTSTMSALKHHNFTAKNPANNSHIDTKFAHLMQQCFFYHLAELQDKPHGDHVQAKKLDRKLQEASKVKSQKVKQF